MTAHTSSISSCAFRKDRNSSAERRLAVVRDLRTRLAALPGVSAITSGRPPEFTGFSDGLYVSAARQSTLYYAYVQANYFETPSESRSFWAAVFNQDAPPFSVNPPRSSFGRARIRLAAASVWAPTDDRAHTASELSAEGPAYLVIGVARDTRAALSLMAAMPGASTCHCPRTSSASNSHPFCARNRIRRR